MIRVAVALAVAVVAFLAPWGVARTVFVPLGWPRAALFATLLGPLVWPRDRFGGSLFVGAWALSRQARPDPAVAAWLRGRVRDDQPVTAAMIAGLGLLAQVRGDRVEARSFLECALLFDDRVTDSVLRRRVSEWLVAEAAERGAWSDVLRHVAGAPGNARVALAAGLARRRLGLPDAPDDDALMQLWRQAPSLHHAARAAMDEALAPEPDPLPVAPVQAPLQAALQLHAALLEAPDPARVQATARAWEHALEAVSPRLQERAAVLGARRPVAEAVATLRDDIVGVLAELVSQLDAPLASLQGGPLLDEAVSRVREEHLVTIELAAASLQTRLDAGRALSVIDEVREWWALARLYDQAVQAGGDELRRLVFRPVYQPLCSLSVLLYNQRNQRWLSNAMTRWLLQEAILAGDQRAVDLQTRNLTV